MAKRMNEITPPRRNTRNRPPVTDDVDSVDEPTVLQERTDIDRSRRIRTGAILLGVFAGLLLIALLTYTERDEANAQLSMGEIIGILRGDPEVRAKAETTHNGLSLLGAVMAHWLYVSGIGIWSNVLPVMMMFWARDLYRFQRITPRVRRFSLTSLAVAVLLACFGATLALIGETSSWFPTVDRVWSGAIGQFLAGTLAQLIGTIGTVAVVIVAAGFVAVMGYDLDPARISSWLENVLAKVSQRVSQISKSSTTSAMNSVSPLAGSAVTSAARRRSEPVRPTGTTAADVDDTNLDVGNDDGNDDAVAETLPVEQTLSSTVRIVRSAPARPVRPSAAAETPETTAPPDAGPVSETRSIQERLQALHPKKTIIVGTDRGPSEPGDEPELPLFLRDDEEAEDVPLPSGVPQRPLVINVEEQHDDAEVEMPLRSTTLYDEEIAYKPPSPSFLVDEKDETMVDDAELERNAQILQEKLETFRIKIENVTVQPGPVVTQYEFVPASGVKVSQIESLADDIALALKAPAVRIIAPIPGKGTVGIEIPNTKASIVRFGSIIKSPKYHNPDIKLPIAMGKTVVGEVYCADLAKMPHLLIAGATGKGKSVGINSIIASLLYRMHPRDVKFVIVDPKRVEMTLYKSLKNHFLAISPDIDETIVTEPHNAVVVLKAVVEEMSLRYNVLAAAGQRNIADYNRKVKEGKITDKGGMTHKPMPYIVVIIDELADLMMTASKEVEEPIVRIAQLARAVGIHCIVATQRPSVDVVTGLIKANFPARIAYQVSSRIDSRTIIDGSGAEHLIGNGDMLFVPGNTPKPIRMQNAFISTEEVEAICEHIGKQKGYSQPYILPSINKRGNARGSADADRDALFEDAARIFVQLQQASVSTLQRRLKVGYARAARIVDELEAAGIVGPPDGAKGRAVMLQSESELEAFL